MNEKIVNKWKPILDAFSYEGNKLEELALYMESHSTKDSKLSSKNIYEIGEKCMSNLLPIASKILMKMENLNLYNLNFTCNESDSLVRYNISIPIGTKNEIEELSKKGIDIVQETETKLIEKASNFVNEAINNLNVSNSEIYFNTPKLVESISIINTDNVTMSITLSYNLKTKINN